MNEAPSLVFKKEGNILEIAALLAVLAFIVPMCFTPGPNNLLCAAHGSQHGVKHTIPLTLGMVVGWSALGLFVGFSTVFIEEHGAAFRNLTYIGAIYIMYLGYKVATAVAISEEVSETERLGFPTGVFLQVLNGKAWIHFLVLMTSFGTVFGTGFAAKVGLVLLNALFGYPAVLTWASFGSYLKRLFSTERSARILNAVLGISLFLVAVWIAWSQHTS